MKPIYKTLGGYGQDLHRPLETGELRDFAPSIFAELPHSRTSSRYSFLPTSSILSGMADEGWLPVAAQEQLVRDQSRDGFQKHMLRFAHRDDLQKPGGERAEIVIVNSHDRISAYQLHAGIFRFVCCNGLVACDETFKRISITHLNFDPSKVIEASVSIADGIPPIMNGLAEMKSLTLTDGEREAFAESAAILRYGSIETAPARPLKLLEPRRYEDSGSDAWRTFNVIQENVTKGGQKDFNKRKPTGARMPIRPICATLRVPRSSYYHAAVPTPTQLSDHQTGDVIEAIFKRHRRRYGYRRIWQELNDQGHACAPVRVRRIMAERDLRALQPKTYVPQTSDGRADKPSPNLLLGQPLPKLPNRVWAGDITFIPTSAGWLYLSPALLPSVRLPTLPPLPVVKLT